MPEDSDFKDFTSVAKMKESFLLLKKKICLSNELIQKYNDTVMEKEHLKKELNNVKSELAKKTNISNSTMAKNIELQIENKKLKEDNQSLKNRIEDQELKVIAEKQHIEQLTVKIKSMESKAEDERAEAKLEMTCLAGEINELNKKLKSKEERKEKKKNKNIHDMGTQTETFSSNIATNTDDNLKKLCNVFTNTEAVNIEPVKQCRDKFVMTDFSEHLDLKYSLCEKCTKEIDTTQCAICELNEQLSLGIIPSISSLMEDKDEPQNDQLSLDIIPPMSPLMEDKDDEPQNDQLSLGIIPSMSPLIIEDKDEPQNCKIEKSQDKSLATLHELEEKLEVLEKNLKKKIKAEKKFRCDLNDTHNNLIPLNSVLKPELSAFLNEFCIEMFEQFTREHERSKLRKRKCSLNESLGLAERSKLRKRKCSFNKSHGSAKKAKLSTSNSWIVSDLEDETPRIKNREIPSKVDSSTNTDFNFELLDKFTDHSLIAPQRQPNELWTNSQSVPRLQSFEQSNLISQFGAKFARDPNCVSTPKRLHLVNSEKSEVPLIKPSETSNQEIAERELVASSENRILPKESEIRPQICTQQNIDKEPVRSPQLPMQRNIQAESDRSPKLNTQKNLEEKSTRGTEISLQSSLGKDLEEKLPQKCARSRLLKLFEESGIDSLIDYVLENESLRNSKGPEKSINGETVSLSEPTEVKKKLGYSKIASSLVTGNDSDSSTSPDMYIDDDTLRDPSDTAEQSNSPKPQTVKRKHRINQLFSDSDTEDRFTDRIQENGNDQTMDNSDLDDNSQKWSDSGTTEDLPSTKQFSKNQSAFHSVGISETETGSEVETLIEEPVKVKKAESKRKYLNKTRRSISSTRNNSRQSEESAKKPSSPDRSSQANSDDENGSIDLPVFNPKPKVQRRRNPVKKTVSRQQILLSKLRKLKKTNPVVSFKGNIHPTEPATSRKDEETEEGSSASKPGILPEVVDYSQPKKQRIAHSRSSDAKSQEGKSRISASKAKPKTKSRNPNDDSGATNPDLMSSILDEMKEAPTLPMKPKPVNLRSMLSKKDGEKEKLGGKKTKKELKMSKKIIILPDFSVSPSDFTAKDTFGFDDFKQLRSRNVSLSRESSTSGYSSDFSTGSNVVFPDPRIEKEEVPSIFWMFNNYFLDEYRVPRGVRKRAPVEYRRIKFAEGQIQRLIDDEEWSVETHKEVIQQISNHCKATDLVVEAILHFLCDPELKLDEFECSPNPLAPPMTRTLQKIVTLITGLEPQYPNIFKETQAAIEYKLFRLVTFTLTMEQLDILASLFIVLCRIKRDKVKVRLFCIDALYCYHLKAANVIYNTIKIWPQVLPFYKESNDYLAKCIMLCIMNKDLIGEYRKVQITKELLFKYYGFPIHGFDVLQMVKKCLDEMQGPGNHTIINTALIIIAKQFGTDWAFKNIIKGGLMKMIVNKTHTSVYAAFDLLGNILRCFPISDVEREVTDIMEQLCDLLDAAEGTHEEQESIARALLCLTRFDFFKVARSILKWKPLQPLRPDTVEKLEIMFHGQAINRWRAFLKNDWKEPLNLKNRMKYQI